jgi:hypothetical protein
MVWRQRRPYAQLNERGDVPSTKHANPWSPRRSLRANITSGKQFVARNADFALNVLLIIAVLGLLKPIVTLMMYHPPASATGASEVFSSDGAGLCSDAIDAVYTWVNG